MQDIIDKEAYVWVSPEGVPALDSIGYSIENLYSITRQHSTGGFFLSLEKHLDEGYNVEKVKISVIK